MTGKGMCFFWCCWVSCVLGQPFFVFLCFVLGDPMWCDVVLFLLELRRHLTTQARGGVAFHSATDFLRESKRGGQR